MYQIQQITNNALQTQTLVLPNGTQFTIEMYFRSLQQGWFFNSIIYNSFILRGLRITASPNMLNQFRNQIPFGLACSCTGNREPSQINDFSSGAANLYILTQAECTQYAEFLASG